MLLRVLADLTGVNILCYLSEKDKVNIGALNVYVLPQYSTS